MDWAHNTHCESHEIDYISISPAFFGHSRDNWAASSEFGSYRLCEQRRFRRACASAQSRQNLRCSLIQAVSQAEPSDRKPDRWPLWMTGHAQLKFVMTECSKTQIRLTRPNYGRSTQFFSEDNFRSYQSPNCLDVYGRVVNSFAELA